MEPHKQVGIVVIAVAVILFVASAVTGCSDTLFDMVPVEQNDDVDVNYSYDYVTNNTVEGQGEFVFDGAGSLTVIGTGHAVVDMRYGVAEWDDNAVVVDTTGNVFHIKSVDTVTPLTLTIESGSAIGVLKGTGTVTFNGKGWANYYR